MIGGLLGKSEGQDTIWDTRRRWEIDDKVNMK